MGSPFARAIILPALLLLSILGGWAPAASAVEEKVWVSLELDADFYDVEQALKDGAGVGFRAAGFLNRHFGIEGLFNTASPTLESPATGDGKLTYYGVGLIATPDRYAWSLPYLYVGGGSVSVDRGTTSQSFGALYFGAGLTLRAGERFGFRFDGRDLTYKQDGGPGRDGAVNEIVISGAITAFWFGRPRDSDEDGVPDKQDVSPDTPQGAVVDATGTPLDTDKDGVFDGLDQSPNTPPGAKVAATGVALDSDRDGVFDGLDQCDSTSAGVIVDAKGCGLDTDGDKIFDGLDKCAMTPAGARVDSTGCPLDADGDGVPDGVDTCPFTPAGAAVNAGGCSIERSPLERMMLEDWLIRLVDIEFPPDSAVLQPQAKARIDSVGTVLAQWPMVKVEIGLHVDDQPEPGFRIPLTTMRARSTLQYLLSTFPMLIQKNFWITGYGDTDPIAPNTSSAGRAMNRRIDFRVENMNALVAEEARRQSFGATAVPPAPGLEPKAPPAAAPEPATPQPATPQPEAPDSTTPQPEVEKKP